MGGVHRCPETSLGELSESVAEGERLGLMLALGEERSRGRGVGMVR